MEKSILLEYISNTSRMKVLRYLIEGRNFDYNITDLLNAGVSWRTLNKLLPRLLKSGVVIKTRKIGRATLYKINRNNIVIKPLILSYDNLILKKLDQIEEARIERISVKISKKIMGRD